MHWHQVPVSLRPAYNSRMDSAVSAESGSTTVSSSGTSLFDNLNPAAVPRRRRRRRSWSDADSLTDAEVHDAGLAGEQQWRKERSQSVKEKASPSVNKLKKRRPASSISPTAPLPPISRTLSCPDGVELAHYTEKASQGSTRSARRSFSFINSQQQRATLAAAAHIVLPRKAFKRRSSLPATSHEPESRPEDVFVPAPSQLDWFMDASPFAVAHPRHHHHRRTQSTPSSVIQKPEFVVDVIGDRGRSFTPSGSSDSIAPGDKDKTARAASVDGRSSHKKSATTSVTTLSPPTHACAHADPAPPAQSQFVTAGHPLSLPVQSGQQPTHSPAYGQISVESQAETDLFAKRALMRSRTLQQLSSTSPDRRYQSFDVNAAIDRSDPAFLTAGEGQFAGPDGDLQHQHQQQQRHLRYRDSLLLPQTDPRPSAARTLHSTHRHQQQQQQSTSPAKSTSSQKYHHHHYHLPSTSPSRPPWTTTKRSRSEPAVLTSQGDQVADSDLHQTMRLPVFHISPGTKHAELEPICTTRARPGKAEAPLGCSRGSNSSSLLSGGNQLELRQHEEHKNIHPRDLDLRQCVSSELAHAQAHYDPGVIDAGPNPDLEEEEGEEDHTSLTNKLGLSFQQPRPHSSRRRPSSVRACLAPQPQSQSQPPSRQPTSKHLRPPLAPPRRSSLQIPVPQPPPASLDPLLALPPAAREMVLRHRQNSEARLSSADVERQQAQQQQHQTVRAVKSSVLTHTRSPSANASAYAHDPRSASSSSSLLTGDNAPDTPPTDLSSRNTSEGPCASQASHAPASQDDIAGLLAPTPRTHRREASAPERPRWRTSWGLLGAGEDSVFSTHPLSQGGSDPSSPASSSPKLGLARRLSQRLVRGITSPKMSDADVDAPPLPVPAVPASSPNKLRKDPPKKLDTLKKPHRYSAEGAPPPRAVPRILTDLKSDVAQEHEAPTQSSSSSSLPASPSMTPGLGHRPQVSAPACRIRSYRSKSSDPLEFLRGARRASAVDSNNSCSTSSSNDPSQDHSYETVPSTVLHTVQESWSATSPLQAIERPEAPLAVPDTRSSVLREFRDREADYSRRLVKLHQTAFSVLSGECQDTSLGASLHNARQLELEITTVTTTGGASNLKTMVSFIPVNELLHRLLPSLIEFSDSLRANWSLEESPENYARAFLNQRDAMNHVFMEWMSAFPTICQTYRQSEPHRVERTPPNSMGLSRAKSVKGPRLSSVLKTQPSAAFAPTIPSSPPKNPLSRAPSLSGTTSQYAQVSPPPSPTAASPSPIKISSSFRLLNTPFSQLLSSGRRPQPPTLQEREEGERRALALGENLSCPLQHLYRYPLLLARLTKVCAPDSAEQRAALAAYNAVADIMKLLDQHADAP